VTKCRVSSILKLEVKIIRILELKYNQSERINTEATNEESDNKQHNCWIA
jgi:hypothetical protein